MLLKTRRVDQQENMHKCENLKFRQKFSNGETSVHDEFR